MNIVYCPNCGQRNDKHNTMCKHCGMKIYQIPPHKDFHCISCGTLNKMGTQYCTNCDFDFSKTESIKPGIKGNNIAQETVHAENKNIFMQKGIYVILGIILIILWGISLFLPWLKQANGNMLNISQYGNMAIEYSKYAKHPFWFTVMGIWAYLPFVAIVLAIITVIRKRIHSIVTYTSFAIPWIICFVLLHFFNGWFDKSFSNIICSGEILFIVCIVLFFAFDRLIYALNITRN